MGVKMSTDNQPEVLYGADGAKYLVTPPHCSNSSSCLRQIIVTHSHSPRRQNSSMSMTRMETPSSPHHSNSSSQRPMNLPQDRVPKIIGSVTLHNGWSLSLIL
ncbi:hypothetical protein FRC08_014293 [Ceratobasidium sp. 394]|nr:hypothetical protein FRC08_014293 [Ceratobasidium sp. 394]